MRTMPPRPLVYLACETVATHFCQFLAEPAKALMSVLP
ncbi:hypothetical protein SM0020_13877 [Sinorhizobium meliloti CCNWSX0020]|jgi:hypothetical protein|uniref:Uncharacterized protein n=1 Tax=Sinorhizobium meliloti CCNWSX0020 TaxID=1107881 RepID=H0FZZ1_RHIML|nr:hypothetical protein SM0020_13877 [Sinorhizobium meliloti CCNWSX0020]